MSAIPGPASEPNYPGYLMKSTYAQVCFFCVCEYNTSFTIPAGIISFVFMTTNIQVARLHYLGPHRTGSMPYTAPQVQNPGHGASVMHTNERYLARRRT